MTTRTVDQVGNWSSRSFSGGYRGLQDLSDEGFSGIVTAGPTRLCMTKGKVVGVLEGDIEDFEGASGTVHEAPSPALPLLAVMQERSDEVRAQYYTEETPISEVDQTLTDGNFTGFVELSENVLSGDYYIVYHQGRSMNVAWVGESSQLLTEDEAFDRTQGEVGIYKVKPVDIEVIEIPEPTDPAPDDTGSGAPAATDADGSDDDPIADADTDDTDESDADDGRTEPDGSRAATDDAETESASSGSTETSTTETGGAATEAGADTRQDRSGSRQGRDGRSGRSRDDGGRQQAPAEAASRRDASQQPKADQQPQASQQGGSPPGSQGVERNAGQPASQSEPTTTGSTGIEGGQRDAAGASGRSDAVGGLETRSIPSLDPDRTSTPSDEGSSGSAPDHGPEPAMGGAQPTDSAPQQQGPAPRQQQSSTARQQASDAGRTQSPVESSGQSQPGRSDGARTQSGSKATSAEGGPDAGQLEAELADREAEIERLEAELDDVEGERDDLEAQLDDVRAERDELEERVEQLEGRVNELRTEEGGESVADRRRMGPGEVIDGTNLFVRYDSKGAATLEAAYKGNAEPTAVNDNLDIQHHTQFDAEDVAVNGEPFGEFLHGTLQYKFVEWAIRVLPYEIRDTGHEGALSDLYEALPDVDRAELNGSISVVYEEDGQEQRSQEQFDVVLRDRMGNPLAVANMNESRQPASQSMMETLITAAQRVGESKESLAGAFFVTSSFFEPEAMEAAEDATGSGLLSRDKRASFVKLSRKDGFHLCLVQFLDGQFELSVPEL